MNTGTSTTGPGHIKLQSTQMVATADANSGRRRDRRRSLLIVARAAQLAQPAQVYVYRCLQALAAVIADIVVHTDTCPSRGNVGIALYRYAVRPQGPLQLDVEHSLECPSQQTWPSFNPHVRSCICIVLYTRLYRYVAGGDGWQVGGSAHDAVQWGPGMGAGLLVALVASVVGCEVLTKTASSAAAGLWELFSR